MLKKIFYIIIATLVLIGTSGVVLTEHFCHNQRVEISINKTVNNCCGKACKHCHNISHYLKIADNFTLSQFHLSKINFTQNIAFVFIDNSLLHQPILSEEIISNTSSPPPVGFTNLYSRFENFRL